MAGLSKCLATYYSQTIFPNINFNKPNGAIKSIKTGTVVIPTSCIPWPKGHNGLMSVSSFGFGGLAGHLVMRPCPAFFYETVVHPVLIPLSLHPCVDIKDVEGDIKERLSDAAFLRYLLSSEMSCGTYNPNRGFIIAQPNTNSMVYSKCQNTNMSVKQLCALFEDCLTGHWTPDPKILNLPAALTSLQLSEKICSDEQKRHGSFVSALKTNSVPAPLQPNGLTLRVACQIALIDVLGKFKVLHHFHTIRGVGLGSIGAAYADGCLTRKQCMHLAHLIETALIEENARTDTVLLKVQLDIDQLYQLGPWVRILDCDSTGGFLIVVLQSKGEEVMLNLKNSGVVFEEQEWHIPVYSALLNNIGKTLAKSLEKVIPGPVVWSDRAEIPNLKARGDSVKYCDAHFFIEVLTTPLREKQPSSSSVQGLAAGSTPGFEETSSSEALSTATSSSDILLNCSTRATRGSQLGGSPYLRSASLSQDLAQTENASLTSLTEDDCIFSENNMRPAMQKNVDPENICETLVLRFFASDGIRETDMCPGRNTQAHWQTGRGDRDEGTCPKPDNCCSPVLQVPASDIGFLSALGHIHNAGYTYEASVQVEDSKHPQFSNYSGDFPTYKLWAWDRTGRSAESDWRVKPIGKYGADVFKMEFLDDTSLIFETPGLSLIPHMFKLVTTFLDSELTGGKVLVLHHVKLLETETSILPQTELGKIYGRMFHQSSKFCLEQVGDMVLKGSYEVLPRNPAARCQRNGCSSVAMNSPEEMLKNLFIIYKHYFDEIFPFRLLWDPLRHKTILMEALKKLKQRKKNVQIACSVDSNAGIIMCGGFILHSQSPKPQLFKPNFGENAIQSLLAPASTPNTLSLNQISCAYYESLFQLPDAENISQSLSTGTFDERLSEERKLGKQVRFSGNTGKAKLTIKEEIQSSSGSVRNEMLKSVSSGRLSETDTVRGSGTVNCVTSSTQPSKIALRNTKQMKKQQRFAGNPEQRKEISSMANMAMQTKLSTTSGRVIRSDEKQEASSYDSAESRDSQMSGDVKIGTDEDNSVSLEQVLPQVLTLTKGDNFSYVRSLNLKKVLSNKLENLMYQFPLSTALHVYITRKGFPSMAATFVMYLFYNGTEKRSVENMSILLYDRNSGVTEACSSAKHALSIVSTYVPELYTYFVAHVYAVVESESDEASPLWKWGEVILAKEREMLNTLMPLSGNENIRHQFEPADVSFASEPETPGLSSATPNEHTNMKGTSYSLNIDSMLEKSLQKLVAVNGHMIAYVVPQSQEQNEKGSENENSSELSNKTLTEHESVSPPPLSPDSFIYNGILYVNVRSEKQVFSRSVQRGPTHRKLGAICMISVENKNWDSDMDSADSLPVYVYGNIFGGITKLNSVSEFVRQLFVQHPHIDKTHEISAVKVKEGDSFDDLLFRFWNQLEAFPECDICNNIGDQNNCLSGKLIEESFSHGTMDTLPYKDALYGTKNVLGFVTDPHEKRTLPEYTVYPMISMNSRNTKTSKMDVDKLDSYESVSVSEMSSETLNPPYKAGDRKISVHSSEDVSGSGKINSDASDMMPSGGRTFVVSSEEGCDDRRRSFDSTKDGGRKHSVDTTEMGSGGRIISGERRLSSGRRLSVESIVPFDIDTVDFEQSSEPLDEGDEFSLELTESSNSTSEVTVATTSSEDSSKEKEVFEILHDPPLVLYSEDSSYSTTSSIQSVVHTNSSQESPIPLLTKGPGYGKSRVWKPHHYSLNTEQPAGLDHLNGKVTMAMCLHLSDLHSPVAQQLGKTTGNLLLYTAKEEAREHGQTTLGLLLIDELTLLHARFHLNLNLTFNHMENIVNMMMAIYILEELGQMGMNSRREKTVLLQPPMTRDAAVMMLLASQLRCKKIITSSSIPVVREKLQALAPNMVVLEESPARYNIFPVTGGKGCDVVVMFQQEDVAEYLELVAVSGSLIICGNVNPSQEIGMRCFLRNLGIHGLDPLYVIRHFMTLEAEKQKAFERKLSQCLLKYTHTINQEYPAGDEGCFFKVLCRVRDLGPDCQPKEKDVIKTFMSKTETSSQVINSVSGDQGKVLQSLHENLMKGFTRESIATAPTFGSPKYQSHRRSSLDQSPGTDESTFSQGPGHFKPKVSGNSPVDCKTTNTPRVRLMSCRRYSSTNLGLPQTSPTKQPSPNKQQMGPQVPVLIKRGFQPTPALQDMVNSREAKSVVKLNDKVIGTPLFMVHPIMGTVSCFEQLADRLPLPVYGIQCTNQAPLTSEEGIPALARYYIEEINKVYPDGPFYLGGYSLGVIISHEMASMLESTGRLKRMIYIDGSIRYSNALLDYEIGKIPSGRSQNTKFFCAVLLSFIRLYINKLSSSDAAAVILAQDTREKQLEMAVDISLGYVKIDFKYRAKEAWHVMSDRIKRNSRIHSYRESLASRRSSSISSPGLRSVLESGSLDDSVYSLDDEPTEDKTDADAISQSNEAFVQNGANRPSSDSQIPQNETAKKHWQELREAIPEWFIAEPARSVAETSERVLFQIRMQKAQLFLQLGLMLQNYKAKQLRSADCVLFRVKNSPSHLLESSLDTQYGLQDLVDPEKLQVFFIEGNHYSCVQKPHVVALANNIATVCKD